MCGADIIQLAWFNGDGVETWQNIWGIWQGLTQRDAAALKRLGPLLRFFGRARRFLQSTAWVPHTPMLQSATAGVYASAWQMGDETLWSLSVSLSLSLSLSLLSDSLSD